MLRIDGLSKRYGSFWALRDARFDVRPGEILGLIGPNGSGKTTLFQCLAGTLPPTAGTIFADGVPLATVDRKKRLFFVPDGIRPWPAQSVNSVLSFIAEMFGLERDAVSAVTAELSLDRLASARMGTLSKGEHKRVLLAIGLLTSPPMLMLDEPFDGLDLRQTREAMVLLRAHAARGRTLFLSIHQLDDAARVCDRLILLSGGRIVDQGTLAELRAAIHQEGATLEEVFLALT